MVLLGVSDRDKSPACSVGGSRQCAALVGQICAVQRSAAPVCAGIDCPKIDKSSKHHCKILILAFISDTLAAHNEGNTR